MQRHSSALRISFSLSINPYFLFSALLITIILTLNSCDSSTKGSYKFQSESMHWLQFRGANASGVAPEDANPPVHFSADTNLFWKVEVFKGWSSPSIVNDRIFLTGFDDQDSLLYTMAIGRENGEVLWKDSVKPHGYYDRHPMYTYADPTVASDGSRVFASFPNYGLIAYDLKGNKLWEYTHELISQYFNGGASSPIVIDSMVVLIVNSEKDPRIVTLNAATGDPVWTIRGADKGWGPMWTTATPVVYNETMILHFSDRIASVAITDGAVKWWIMVPSTGVTTPVIMEDMMYVNTWINGGEESVRGKRIPFAELLEDYDENGDGKIVIDELKEDLKFTQRPENTDALWSSANLKGFAGRFDINKDQVLEEHEWNTMLEYLASYFKEHGMHAIPLKGSGERSFTDILWKVNKDTPETPSPLVVGEYVLFIKNGGILSVIHRESGEVVHHKRIGAAGGYFASPMLAGKRIYLCSFNGTITILSADDFSVLAQNKLREKISASPVAIDDVLYIRTDKHLYAFREQ
ncbi:MAG: PQQ-binding-like beta-propeller repeat protein [Bacteroidota bacterium]